MNTPTINATTAPAPCPFQTWAGYPLPTDRETLWEEFERLSSPTFPEFAADKAAARDAVHEAVMKLEHEALYGE